MSDKRIYTAADWEPAIQCVSKGSPEWRALVEHHYHADHCGGYEVAFWPCPVAAKVLDRLLGGAA